jgi:1,4-dihydroxy-2-naphthoate polyprenyltransferase
MATVFSSIKRKNSFSLKTWLLEARPQYLLLPVTLTILGTSTAWYDGAFNIIYALLVLLGLLLTHSSVNILNDYVDYKSGVDMRTLRTPFSGGSGMLPSKRLTPGQVLWYGVVCLILAVPIGVFFIIVQGWQLLPLIGVAGICILLYTPVILKTPFPEWSPGLGLGVLPVLGAYFAQTGYYSLSAVAVAVPAGLLVSNLLLLNEFPDAEADVTAGRKTLPIIAGKKKAAVVYTVFMILTYIWISAMVITGIMPKMAMLPLLTLPFAFKAIRGSFHYSDLDKLIPAMANNVITALGVPLLLGIGYILSAVFPILR